LPQPLLSVRNLKKWFPVRTGFFATLFAKEREYVHAVDGISFDIMRKEIFCLAGESGCGKTTTGKLVLRLIEPTDGTIIFDGKNVLEMDKNELKQFRRRAQMIFQDPYESLDSRMTVYETIAEPLEVHKLASSREEKLEKVIKALELVKLVPPEEFLFRYPHELSGGQRQRVAIAASMVMEPEFVVADEPVSMLDASVRGGILTDIMEIRRRTGITLMYITHDLSIAYVIADRIAVMYLGRIVEMGDVKQVFKNPLHPYTKALLSVVPLPQPKAKLQRKRIILRGEPPNPIKIPQGCRFHPRCYIAKEICRRIDPELVEVERGHYVACHFSGEG